MIYRLRTCGYGQRKKNKKQRNSVSYYSTKEYEKCGLYYIEKKNEKLDIPVSASFGYALGNDIENDFQVILERADENMYQNKALKKKQLHEDIK